MHGWPKIICCPVWFQKDIEEAYGRLQVLINICIVDTRKTTKSLWTYPFCRTSGLASHKMHGISSNKKGNNPNHFYDQNPWSWDSWNGSVIIGIYFYSYIGLQKSNNEKMTSPKHTYITLLIDDKWLILSLLIIYRHSFVLELYVTISN